LTTSRLQSHSPSGQIQAFQITYELIKDDFVCEPHATVNLKGKGEIEVWLVTGESKLTLSL